MQRKLVRFFFVESYRKKSLMSIDAIHLGDNKFSASMGVTPDALPDIQSNPDAENSQLGCPPTMPHLPPLI